MTSRSQRNLLICATSWNKTKTVEFLKGRFDLPYKERPSDSNKELKVRLLTSYKHPLLPSPFFMCVSCVLTPIASSFALFGCPQKMAPQPWHWVDDTYINSLYSKWHKEFKASNAAQEANKKLQADAARASQQASALDNYDTFKNDGLKASLKDRGLKQSGNSKEMKERLRADDASKRAPAAAGAGSMDLDVGGGEGHGYDQLPAQELHDLLLQRNLEPADMVAAMIEQLIQDDANAEEGCRLIGNDEGELLDGDEDDDIDSDDFDDESENEGEEEFGNEVAKPTLGHRKASSTMGFDDDNC